MAEGGEAPSERAADVDGRQLSAWSGVPFAGLLLSIALFPLLAPGFWHRHFGKVAAGWAFLGLCAPPIWWDDDLGRMSGTAEPSTSRPCVDVPGFLHRRQAACGGCSAALRPCG